MQEVGVAANSTVLTLRELLSNAVDAGADPRFAPWRQADQETTLEALDAAQKSQLEADSGRGNTRRVSIEERLAAARRKSAEVTRPNLQFPEMLPKPRPLPQYGHPPDAYVDQMSTPNKLSKPNEDDNSDPEDYQPESSKGSPDSTRKMRRAQLAQRRIRSRLISLLTSHLLLGPEVASVPTHLLHSPERCSTWAAENRKWWPRIPRTPLHRCSAGTLHLDYELCRQGEGEALAPQGEGLMWSLRWNENRYGSTSRCCQVLCAFASVLSCWTRISHPKRGSQSRYVGSSIQN